MLPLLALAGISAGVGTLASSIGAAGAGVNNKKAKKEETRSYNEAKGYLDSEYYRDPMSSVSNQSLLKSLDQRMRDTTDAINNRAVAGGATMENQLASRQAANETMSNVYSQLLQGEDARRQALNNQRMQLNQQHSANLQNNYLQNAQNWQAWGATMGDAAMSFGSTAMEAMADGLTMKDLLIGKK